MRFKNSGFQMKTGNNSFCLTKALDSGIKLQRYFEVTLRAGVWG
jgi:hypothetical protein